MNTERLMIYQGRCVKSSTVWLLFFFFGWSYGSMDKIGLQILFYLTAGGLGVWALIRLFTLSSSIKSYNRKVAAQIGMDNQEMATLNLL